MNPATVKPLPDMKLQIVSAKNPAIEAQTSKVFFPGADGSFEILKNHAPLIAALGKGEIRWEGGTCSIKSGFVKVENNLLTAAVEM